MKLVLIVIIIMILICSLLCNQLLNTSEKAIELESLRFKKNQKVSPLCKDISQFKHGIVKKRYHDIVKEFGRPHVLFNKPGGVAVWMNTDVYSTLLLMDESIEHNQPKPHCDFLYGTVKVHIPDEILIKVLMLSKSVTYDRLKKELTARCHFSGAITATLYLALKIVNDHRNSQKYYDMYGPTIMSTMKSNCAYLDLKSQLKELVGANLKQYPFTINENCKM
jgi:hypothetical protein